MPTEPAAGDRPTAIAVPIRLPAAIERVRRRWDLAARSGAPAHVTVLYPFVTPDRVSPELRRTLATVAEGVPGFDVRFDRVVRVADDLLWLEPEPAAPFVQLTAAVVERWPDRLPYGGRHPDLVAHVTIVEAQDAPFDEVERIVRAHLPFSATADRLELWFQDVTGRWHVGHWFRLG